MVNAWWVNQGQSSKLGHGFGLVWAPLVGDTGGSVPSWNRMDHARPGDLVIHYANGAARGFSIVVAPSRLQKRPYDGGTWNNEGRILDVDYVALDMPIPLAEVPLDLRLSEPRPHSAFNKVGGVNQGYFYPLTIDLARAVLDTAGVAVSIDRADDQRGILLNGATDRQGVALMRVEQPALRRLLLAGRSEAQCGLCGDVLPVEYLVAAHIKRRADCTEKERADRNVAMLACLFGCDTAFELGHLRVGDDGTIRVGGPVLAVQRLTRLQGHIAIAFTPATRRYFRAHRITHASSRPEATGHPR